MPKSGVLPEWTTDPWAWAEGERPTLQEPGEIKSNPATRTEEWRACTEFGLTLATLKTTTKRPPFSRTSAPQGEAFLAGSAQSDL